MSNPGDTIAQRVKIFHIKKRIYKFIVTINSIKDRPEKQKIAIEMLRFLKEEGMLLIEKNPNFKMITIDKCKEFQKIKNPELYKTCQDLLDMIQESKN